MKKRCTNSSCRKVFDERATSTCPHCGKEYPRLSRRDLILSHHGPCKLAVIKVVRRHTGLGLKNAKTLVDNVPSFIGNMPAKLAADIQWELEDAGGTAKVVSSGSSRKGVFVFRE